ncbi:hypothetical protein H0A36_17420 [Endozoicomonas sp. SM1973]|uniref:Uncharacterized protein n=1 Tax=Spartinivicinus marinus TaxID=2994442 RepID=A0A853IJG9_9GAMM|nr:hypothetical protein [Spartinivicinus marinus]MCX4030153.1 hypothetical protein [Spartinivicinus marinus]NYZ67796.1 hypothetical protein [Spartinivicinus marinus]
MQMGKSVNFEYSEDDILSLLNKADSKEFQRCHAFFLLFMDQIRGIEEYIDWDEHPIKELNQLLRDTGHWSFKTIERWLPKLIINKLSIFTYQFLGADYVSRWNIKEQTFRSFAFENNQIFAMPNDDSYPPKREIANWLTSGLTQKC